MNVLKRELKAGIKPFFFWSLGLFVLVYAGIIKSTGLTATGEGLSSIVEAFPKIIKAVIGMSNIDIGTFSGYYAVLLQYAIILTAVYSVYLGSNAVSREVIDKTYEFIFIKPRSRNYILLIKFAAALIYLTLFCILMHIFSLSAVAGLNIEAEISLNYAVFTISSWLTGLVFLSASTMFSAICKKAELGAKFGNSFVLVSFVTGVIYEMTENNNLLRSFLPFKYFLPAELIGGKLNILYAVLCFLLFVICIFNALKAFDKKDLKES